MNKIISNSVICIHNCRNIDISNSIRCQHFGNGADSSVGRALAQEAGGPGFKSCRL